MKALLLAIVLVLVPSVAKAQDMTYCDLVNYVATNPQHAVDNALESFSTGRETLDSVRAVSRDSENIATIALGAAHINRLSSDTAPTADDMITMIATVTMLHVNGDRARATVDALRNARAEVAYCGRSTT